MKPLVTIVDLENNEISEREMNELEYADYLNREKEFLIQQKVLRDKSEQRLELLNKLNITEDEARLLLGETL